MNRILLTLLTITALSALTLGQEREKPDLHRPEAPPSQTDTTLQSGEYVPLWESDTIIHGKDSVPLYVQAPLVQGDTAWVEPDFTHSASKALMYSLVLPGLGQAYNHKYWKMPIVWLAMGGAGYAISYNTRNYQLASEEYSNNPDDTNERILRGWRRYVELSYISMIAVYALQVLDAYVDAQLYSWDVNDNLSLRVAPSLQPLMSPSSLTGHAYGLTCSFKLKR